MHTRTRVHNTSINSKKRMSDKGSPWHSPLTWEILSPGKPLMTTLVLAIESKVEI
jgi:hypothetical protein